MRIETKIRDFGVFNQHKMATKEGSCRMVVDGCMIWMLALGYLMQEDRACSIPKWIHRTLQE